MDSVKRYLLTSELKNARNAQVLADTATRKVYETVAKLCPGIDITEVETLAENADSLEEAISCYIQYGEYTAEAIVEELESLL